LYLPDFFWKYRRPITLVLLLSLSCLFMIDSCHRKWVARAGGELVLGVVSPVQKTSESIYDGGRNLLSVTPDFFRTRAQNAALRRRVGELEQKVVLLRERMLAEQRERALLEFVGPLEPPKILARVIGTDPAPWFSTVIVDRGDLHGVRDNLPVLSSAGLVGHVINTYQYSSKVLLLTDSNSKISVVVQRSRAHGVVQGNDEGGCVLKYLESTADVTTGDTLITSGSSRIYPRGLLVGHVDEIKSKSGDLFQWAHVVPATDVNKIEEVAIIIIPDAAPEVAVTAPVDDKPTADAAPEVAATAPVDDKPKP